MHDRTLNGGTSLRVPCDPSSLGPVRAALLGALSAVGTVAPERCENAALVLSELLGNAIRHAAPLDDGQFLVTWRLGDSGLRVSVSDGGAATRPTVVRASQLSTAGRGMSIVEALAEHWWRDVRGPVSTVYALLRV